MTTNFRPELAWHLIQRIKAFREGFRHNLALIGAPGSGKTYQLQQLLGSCPEGTLVIYCPLYQESCATFLQRLLTAVIESGLTARKPQSPATLNHLLQEAHAQLPRTAAAAGVIDSLLSRRLYSEAFNRILDLIPVLAGERGLATVLILDEFLLLEEMGFSHAFHELGKRVMIWPSTLFILSSSSPYRARIILRERLQLLFGQFELITFDDLNMEIANGWAQKELRGIEDPQTALPFLVDWLSVLPWYLTVFFNRLKELMALQCSLRLGEGILTQAVWDVLGKSEGTLHQWYRWRIEQVAHLRHGRKAVEALLHLAQGVRTATELSRHMGRTGLSEALQVLIEYNLAQRNGTCWLVDDPVFRCWLSTVVLTQRLDARRDAFAVRQKLEAYLDLLWKQWLHRNQSTFTEHIADLFSRFCDDTVSLDSKTGRLPSFRQIEPVSPQPAAADTYLVAQAKGKRWCVAIKEGPIDEQAVAQFEGFCKTQQPKPSRKLVITRSAMEHSARVAAKTANMWVWEANELKLLEALYRFI